MSDKVRVAENIIYIIGETHGLEWELRMAVEKGYHRKFFFVFPPRWVVHADNREFYERFLALTGLPDRIEPSPILLYYDGDDAPVLVVANKQSAREYRLAMRLAFESRRDR